MTGMNVLQLINDNTAGQKSTLYVWTKPLHFQSVSLVSQFYTIFIIASIIKFSLKEALNIGNLMCWFKSQQLVGNEANGQISKRR